jgi:hypothetical protein
LRGLAPKLRVLMVVDCCSEGRNPDDEVAMNFRILALFTAFVAVGAVAFGAGRDPGEVVQVISVDVRPSGAGTQRGHVQVEIKLRNNSPGIVTAYHYEVVASYADGSRRMSDAGVDEVSQLANELVRKRLGQGGGAQANHPESPLFLPGGTRMVTAAFPLSASAEPPVSVDVRITMVVLDDGAVFGDQREIEALRLSRRHQVEPLTAFVDDLRRIKAHPDPAACASKLAEEARHSQAADAASQVRRNLLGGVAAMLQRDAGAIGKWLAGYETHLAVLVDQSVLRDDSK